MNGSDDVIISESPDGFDILMQDNGGQAGTDEVYQYITDDDGTVLYSDDSVHAVRDSAMTDEETAEFYSKYEQYGLKYEDGRLYYKGEPVRFFDDVVSSETTEDGGITEFMSYLDSDGTVVLTAEREQVSDGIGGLTGVRVVPDEELKLIRSDSRF